MKKYFPFALGIIITSAVFYSCSVLNSLKEVQQNGFICSNYSEQPVNKMDKQTVLSMIRNYYNQQYKSISNATTATNFTTTTAQLSWVAPTGYTNFDIEFVFHIATLLPNVCV